MFSILILSAVAAFPFSDGSRDETGWTGPRTSAGAMMDWQSPKTVMWDNGPFVTGIGQGAAGADVSEMNEGEITPGFGFQVMSDFAVADQFEVDGYWSVYYITVFGYQTGSGTNPTINDIRLVLYDDPPATGSILYGDPNVNVLTSNEWTNCYRVHHGELANTDRAIIANQCELFWALYPGEYWLEIQASGTGSSGPWANPVTIPGQLCTGDALQRYLTTWTPIAMGGTGEGIGIPFIIEQLLPLERTTWGQIKTLF